MGPDSRHKAKLEKRQPSVLCSQDGWSGVGSQSSPGHQTSCSSGTPCWMVLSGTQRGHLICPRALVSCPLLGEAGSSNFTSISYRHCDLGILVATAPGSFGTDPGWPPPWNYSWGAGYKVPLLEKHSLVCWWSPGRRLRITARGGDAATVRGLS